MEENLLTKAMADMIVNSTLDIKETDSRRCKIMEAEARVCLGKGLEQGNDYLGNY